MDDQELLSGVRARKKVVVLFWGLAGGAWGFFVNVANSRSKGDLIGFFGTAAISLTILALLVTIACWAFNLNKQPLDSDGRMPLPKEPDPRLR